mgnify:CR=1 FL=1
MVSVIMLSDSQALAGLEEDALMACNLGYRSKYVVRAAKAVSSGEVDLAWISSLNYQKAGLELLKLFGVGGKSGRLYLPFLPCIIWMHFRWIPISVR